MLVACQRDCPDACLLDVEVSEGWISKVRGADHPVTKGFACPKALNFPKLYRENRVLYPHVREGEGFRRIGWDEALDLLASKLKEVIKEYGADQVIYYNYAGNAGLISYLYPMRFFNALNATGIEHTICDEAGEVAIELHYGMRYGAFPHDLEKAKMIVVWGANLSSSSVHAYKIVVEAKKKGTKLWVIDPRRTKVATLGRHVRVRPGMDFFLAAGISKIIVEEGLYDGDFIRDYTKGFDKYKEFLSRIDLGDAERLSGVSLGVMREIALDYAELKPSVTYVGVALQKSVHGAETLRAITLIPALVGVHRGFYFCNSSRDFQTSIISGKKTSNRVNMLDVGSLLARGEFKFIYIYGANPAVTAPRSDIFRNALRRKDLFVVVHDVFWSETAKLADLVLPATSMFEHDEVVASWWHDYIHYSKAVVPPMGESRPNWWVTRELARRMSLDEEVWADPMELVGDMLRESSMIKDLNELRDKVSVRLKYPPKESYQTPSGRIEFYSTKAESMGYSPLPSIPQVEEGHGFFSLLTSSVPQSTSSQDLKEESPIHISPVDAEGLGLKEGDLVILRSDEGSTALAKVRVDDSLPPGVLWARRGAKLLLGAVNDLTTRKKQRIKGGNAFNSSKVKVIPFYCEP